MTDQRDLLQVQRFDYCREIVGISVHVIAGGRLAGSAVATSIVRDAAEAVLCKEEHLPVPHVSVQWPPVRERDGRAAAPILVVDLGSVFRGDGTQLTLSFWCLNTW